MNTDTYTYRVPTWAVIALEYGDYSGLSEEDCTAVDNFVGELPNNRLGFEYGEESYFSAINDVHRLGDDVVDAVLTVEVTEEVA